MISEQTIREAVERIVAAARPSKVIVFGSHARRDSDLDLLVIEPNSRSDSSPLKSSSLGMWRRIIRRARASAWRPFESRNSPSSTRMISSSPGRRSSVCALWPGSGPGHSRRTRPSSAAWVT
jgi:hypothetical protein